MKVLAASVRASSASVTAVLNCASVQVIPTILVWSHVLVPDTVVVPVTARVGVEAPEIVTVFTVVGVIAPSDTVRAQSLLDADTPLAVVTRFTSVPVVAGNV